MLFCRDGFCSSRDFGTFLQNALVILHTSDHQFHLLESTTVWCDADLPTQTTISGSDDEQIKTFDGQVLDSPASIDDPISNVELVGSSQVDQGDQVSGES